MKLLPLLSLLLFCAATLGATELSPATLPGLQALIGPAENEQNWLQIPWETDLATARAKAEHTKRPVFLWEMDGHPLGCT